MNTHGMGMPFMIPLQEMKGGLEELSAKGAAAGVKEFSADMISPGAHTGAITNSRYGAGPRHERSIQLLKQQMDDGASRHARAVYAAAHSRARGLKRKPFDDYSSLDTPLELKPQMEIAVCRLSRSIGWLLRHDSQLLLIEEISMMAGLACFLPAAHHFC